MNAVIFTPNSTDPIHPRLKFVYDQLSCCCENVSIINHSKVNSKWDYAINSIFFWFFDLNAIIRSIRHIKQYDFLFIQDLRLVPLLLFIPPKKKFMVYETLDNSVHWHYYHLSRKYSLFKYLRFIPSVFSKIEKKIAFRANSIIVNSDALYEYFEQKAAIVYYSSNLEDTGLINNSANKPALLYLGGFTTDKGALETILLKKHLGIPLIVIGNISEKEVSDLLDNNENIVYEKSLSQDDLCLRMKELLKEYYLIGVSLIKPVHYSYATQEANKDIDYLSLGIPIIGNERAPTFKKISAGCGFLYNDNENILKLINDLKERDLITATCISYYKANFSKKITEQKFMDAVKINKG